MGPNTQRPPTEVTIQVDKIEKDATRTLRQASRCQHIKDRITLEVTGRCTPQRIEGYQRLDVAACLAIIADTNADSAFEAEFADELAEILADKANVLATKPGLVWKVARARDRYHTEHRNSNERAKNELDQFFNDKLTHPQDGLKHLAKAVNEGNAQPLLVLARPWCGPAGEPVGSLTSGPDDVDAIGRYSWGSILAGNLRHQEASLTSFMDNYKHEISIPPPNSKPNRSPQKM